MDRVLTHRAEVLQLVREQLLQMRVVLGNFFGLLLQQLDTHELASIFLLLGRVLFQPRMLIDHVTDMHFVSL